MKVDIVEFISHSLAKIFDGPFTGKNLNFISIQLTYVC
jgi:hypothetical protein